MGLHIVAQEKALQLPRVSIVIPAKNEERDLGKCLKSLALLDYPAELVDVTLVDNGSSDDTRKIAREHGVRVLRDDDATIARLRNLGSAQAMGEILAFIDADMEVDPAWLRLAVGALEDPEVGAVGGMLNIPDDPTWVEFAWSLKRSMRPERGYVDWLGSGNFLLRKDVFQEVGGWNEDLITCEDLDICDRIKVNFRLLHYTPVAAIHHGGAKTLGEVFRKEIWRGRNNQDRLANIWRQPRDIPTLLFPPLHGLFLICLVVALALGSKWSPYIMGLALLFPGLRALLVVVKSNRPSYFFQLLVIWFVYYCARAVASFPRF